MKEYTEEQIFQLCLIAMNKGITLRQNQLDGCGPNKSGQEILVEWFEVIKNRKKAGLDIFA